MKRKDIIRAWKDPEYRNSLTATQHALIPDNPAGIIELSDADLNVAAGGNTAPTKYITGCGPGCQGAPATVTGQPHSCQLC
jgi:mersacidin/lichenicidin family type 2 lantibiotic